MLSSVFRCIVLAKLIAPVSCEDLAEDLGDTNDGVDPAALCPFNT